MTETEAPAPQPVESAAVRERKQVFLIYGLFMVGFPTVLPLLVGAVMAFRNIKNAGEMARSHFVYQIYTFVGVVVLGVIGLLLMKITIGFLVLLFAVIWGVTRCVKGLTWATQYRGVANPTNFRF
ncbi:DUF4870 family protein [Pararhodospirillum oryzae]|uniref:DUF4870 domain-containing protein n=1 Tax=Pararhodospirillum oryzae TaxID=478448 RepID=A0A512H536_9PROT|nr:hypothetical protein [Pararhodospirillum oryzae]GEO80557.1 hypothetical protein ROR02_06880 [Pararhodospirillum oryzae]